MPLSLTCPSAPITAIVSSTADGLSKVEVDNYLDITVTQGTSQPSGPYDICGVTPPGSLPAACFTKAYQTGRAIGDDPDNFVATWGLGPFDIHSYLAPGVNQITFATVDIGSVLSSSTIYLYTNCTSNGVTGGGQITGNPIPSTNPPASALTQGFDFSSTNNKVIESVLDFSTAEQQGTLTITNGTIPTVVDEAIDPVNFPAYVANTSFATSTAWCILANCCPADYPAANFIP